MHSLHSLYIANVYHEYYTYILLRHNNITSSIQLRHNYHTSPKYLDNPLDRNLVKKANISIFCAIT